jgi:hypothetical protein
MFIRRFDDRLVHAACGALHGHGGNARFERADHKRDHPRIAVAPRCYTVGSDIVTRQ